MGLCFKLLVVLVPVLAGAFYYAVHFSPMSGIVPLFHVGIPRGYSESQMPDLSGKLALVTGANVGLGRGTAQLLAKHGAHVHVTCRSESKCAGAVKDIESAIPAGGSGKASCSLMELSSLKSVQSWLQQNVPKLREAGGIDMLILNAGVMATPFQKSEDGIEWQFAVNHLGHFFITTGLTELVEQAAKRSGDGRVVFVSSLAHMGAPPSGVSLSLEQINDERRYLPEVAYGQSKLANILTAKELQRRLDESHGGSSNIYVNAVHPGGVQGDLMKPIKKRFAQYVGDGVMDFIEKIVLSCYWTEQDGALTSLYPATSPEVAKKQIKGQYFIPIARVFEPSAHAQNATLAQELWKFSEGLALKT